MIIELSCSDNPNNPGIVLCGDIFFKIVNSKNKNLICRFAINTSFVDSDTNKYILEKKSVDPDSIAKNKKIDDDFKIELCFEEVCKTCRPENKLS